MAKRPKDENDGGDQLVLKLVPAGTLKSWVQAKKKAKEAKDDIATSLRDHTIAAEKKGLHKEAANLLAKWHEYTPEKLAILKAHLDDGWEKLGFEERIKKAATGAGESEEDEEEDAPKAGKGGRGRKTSGSAKAPALWKADDNAAWFELVADQLSLPAIADVPPSGMTASCGSASASPTPKGASPGPTARMSNSFDSVPLITKPGTSTCAPVPTKPSVETFVSWLVAAAGSRS